MRLYTFPLPQCRFAANVSTIHLVLSLAVIVVFALADATDPLLSSSLVVPDNQTAGGLIVSDNSAQIQFALGSHNGLELRDGTHSENEDEDVMDLDIVRRAPPEGTALANNQFQSDTIKLGDTRWWYFPKEEVHHSKGNLTSNMPDNILEDGQRSSEGEREGRDKAVYITLTICNKPSLSDKADPKSRPDLPQLEVYASKSVHQPGPGHSDISEVSDEGYLKMIVEADNDVYLAVKAPNSTDYTGSYDYHIAASIDAFFHRSETTTNLFAVDTDDTSAILTSGNLTMASAGTDNFREWMEFRPPYTMFAYPDNDSAIMGMRKSYCGLERNALVKKNGSNIETEMTSRGLGKKPKEQFYVKGLDPGTLYWGVTALMGNTSASGNGVVRGGGQVFRPANFTTKSDGNCALIFGLDFCSEVAYAVPSNPSINSTQLRTMYDNHAKTLNTNFTYSLQQIQCEAPEENMYSLTVNCTNCTEAYKEWLCSMVIPRCEDYSNKSDFLRPRNAGQDFFNGTSLDENHPDRKFPPSNQSRSSMIDEEIKPGPYKEVLPCIDVCHNLVRSCPSKLEFSCPQGDRLNISYGMRSNDGFISCNYMGAAYYLNAARNVREHLWFVLYSLVVFWTVSWMHV